MILPAHTSKIISTLNEPLLKARHQRIFNAITPNIKKQKQSIFQWRYLKTFNMNLAD